MSLLSEVIVYLWFLPLAFQVFCLCLLAASLVKKVSAIRFSGKKKSATDVSLNSMQALPKAV